MCTCVHACVRACVHACVRACVRACVHVCTRTYVSLHAVRTSTLPCMQAGDGASERVPGCQHLHLPPARPARANSIAHLWTALCRHVQCTRGSDVSINACFRPKSTTPKVSRPSTPSGTPGQRAQTVGHRSDVHAMLKSHQNNMNINIKHCIARQQKSRKN